MALRDVEPAWYVHALCAGPIEFYDFPENKIQEEKSKSVCKVCPVRLECLTHALCVPIPYGIWGGLNEKQRKMLPVFVKFPIPRKEEEVLLILIQNMND